MFVTKVKPGGNAEKTKKIKPGMVLMAVNGTTILNKSKKETIEVIKAIDGDLTMRLMEAPDKFAQYQKSKSEVDAAKADSKAKAAATASAAASNTAVEEMIYDNADHGAEEVAPLPAKAKKEKEEPKLSRRESEKRNYETSQKLAVKEGRDMTREEQLGLGSASTEDTSKRLSDMTFDFSFGN